MKSRVMLTAMMLAAALAACDGGGEGCGPGEIRLPDGTCVSPDADADSDAVSDDAGEGIGDPGEGMDGIETVDGDDTAGDGEEGEPCESPCTATEECDNSNVCLLVECSTVLDCCVPIYSLPGDPPYTDGDPCGDDLFCNGSEYCIDYACYTEPLPPECDVTNPCAIVECNEDTDTCPFAPLANGTSCDDGSYCTGENDTCQDGYCQYVTPCPAFTGNRCTLYVCYETEPHCVEEPKPDGEECSDSDPCNGTEFCEAGACTFVEPACFDSDPCTTDECVSGTGACNHNAIADCIDCTGGTDCDDGNICTTDFCRNVGGVIECEWFPRHGCTP